MICTCTCVHMLAYLCIQMCVREYNKKIQDYKTTQKSSFTCVSACQHFCVCVCFCWRVAMLDCVCVRLCACMCVSPPFADCSCHPRKMYRHSKWRYNLASKNNNAIHIFTKYIKCATNLLFCTRNSQIKSLNVFVPMRQCMHVWVCVRLSVFANFVAGNFHTKLLLTCVIQELNC